MSCTRFMNVRILRAGAIIRDDLWIKGGTIIDPQPRFWDAQSRKEFAADFTVDCHNLLLAPGFIDLQVNGAYGVDFSSFAEDSPFDPPSFLPPTPAQLSELFPKLQPPDPPPRLAPASITNATYNNHNNNNNTTITTTTNATNNNNTTTPNPHSESPSSCLGSEGQSSGAPHPVRGLVVCSSRGSSSDCVPSPLPPLALRMQSRLRHVADRLPRHGVTSFLPTVITSSAEEYRQTLPYLRLPPRGAADLHANALGVHVEGPFINETAKGAHPPEKIRSSFRADAPEQTLLDCYGDLDNVRLVTLAPELAGAAEAIEYLRSRGIVISAGHSMATFTQGVSAIQRGVSMVTHLFNAMKLFHHRDPGLVGLLSVPHVHFGIISDGIHCHPASIRIAHAANPRALVLVTDSMEAMGLAPGRYRLGCREVDISETGEATIAGTTTLAGAVVPMDECIRRFRKFAQCSLIECLEAASLHPARVLGLEGTKGSLDFGSDADFVLLDDDLRVRATWIDGREVWRDPSP